MNIDMILAKTALEVFMNLESGQRKIIRTIARSGPLNIEEIGKVTKRYAIGFDRWGVKKRLYGTNQFLSLITNDYVRKIRVNKKETTYGLTLKGLLTSFSMVKFEDVYLIESYTNILRKCTDDSKKVELILNYIKHEIVYLLYYNDIQGLNWLKFRFLKPYIGKQRSTYRANFNLELIINKKLLTKPQRKVFNDLEKSYGDSYELANMSTGSVRLERVYRAWVRTQLKQKFNPKIREVISLFIFTRLWQGFIDLPKIEISNSKLVGTFLDYWGFDYQRAFLALPRREREQLSRQSP